MARFCATGAGQWAASLYVWPLSRNKCRTSWVRQTNWGLGMSYVAYMAYAVYQSIHLVYTALSACWFMKEKLSSTMQQMAHFMGHKARGDGDCMDYHVSETKRWDTLTGMVGHPPQTWLNPDELVPQWDVLLPLWWGSLNDCDRTLRTLTSQVSGLLNSQAPCPPVLRNL